MRTVPPDIYQFLGSIYHILHVNTKPDHRIENRSNLISPVCHQSLLYAPEVQEYISASYTNSKPKSRFVTLRLTALLCALTLIIWI